MLLKPKNTKYRKIQRSANFSKTNNNVCLLFADSCGLRALESYWIRSNQIEAARKAIMHCTKRVGSVYIRIFPDKPLTARTKESRMGSGKGAVDHWVANVRSQSILFEINTFSKDLSLKALSAAKDKLPLKTEIIENLSFDF